MENLLLNIDLKSSAASPSEKSAQKNKDKYKRAKQKIIDKRKERQGGDADLVERPAFKKNTDLKHHHPN